MRAPLKLMPPWPKEQLARIREMERDFHIRAFGEEMARVNLDMDESQRRAYLDWMRNNARRHGLNYTRPAPYGFSEKEATDQTD